MRIRSFAAALVATAGVSGCSPVVPVSSGAEPVSRVVEGPLLVKGSFSYRQRIALPPGAVLHVTLSDVSVMDVAAPVLAQEHYPLDGRQVPLPYLLKVDAGTLTNGMRYAVSARISSADGRLLWVTDTTYLLPDDRNGQVDMGDLPLVMVSAQ